MIVSWRRRATSLQTALDESVAKEENVDEDEDADESVSIVNCQCSDQL